MSPFRFCNVWSRVLMSRITFGFFLTAVMFHLCVPVAADVDEPATILDFLLCSSVSEGGGDGPTTTFGPAPYLQVGDTPGGFFDDECDDSPHFEDFEDGVLDPFLSIDNGEVLGPGALTDSVDGDDGTIDGLGDEGSSWYSGDDNTSVTITFANPVTAAGLVFTDGDFATTNVRFAALASDGNLLTEIGAGDLTDQSYYGTTEEDRFFGVTSSQGIASLHISIDAGAGIEVDHIQWQTCTSEGDTGFDDNDDDYDVLISLVDVLGLTETLDEPSSELTVFAPSDGAFITLATDLGFAGGTEEEAADFIVATLIDITPDAFAALDAIVRYHVSPTAISADDFLTLSKNGTAVETLLPGFTVTPSFGTIVDGANEFEDPAAATPNDVMAGSGFVHTIDRVLLPLNPPTN